MELIKRENVAFFQFPAFNRFPGLVHAVASRKGGFSQKPFDTLNLGGRMGDDPERVALNRAHWRTITGGGIHVYATQNHGTCIRVITADRLTPAARIQTQPVPADALITNLPGVRLSIQTADCQAVLLFDPHKLVVANVHCGWRGSVAGLIGQVVAKMKSRFGCDPTRMVAAIGPSLGPCCAEFVHYEEEIPEILWPFRVGAHHFDFWRISRHQLASAGVPDERIYSANACTRCNPHLFFSYRAERRTGRFATLIGLRENT